MSGLTLRANDSSEIRLFLCGDLMLGRGIDQVLPHPSDPRLFEPYVRDARDYVALAEGRSGSIPRPVDCRYIWGDALEELSRVKPDLRIVNLETSITTSDEAWPHKGIHYRLHPGNIPCLKEAEIDFCSLANNHILDWGYSGLIETMEALAKAKIAFAGAGRNLRQAARPAMIEAAGKARLILFALCSASSGVPSAWAATKDRAGVNLVADLSERSASALAAELRALKRPGDILIVSIHWGGNWGYEVPEAHRGFAHRLIDEAGADLIHGHSSHHPRPIEVYRGKLILYGCGDFINDYEGIGGYESYRGDLVLMYFPRIEAATGRLLDLEMTPLQIKRFRLQRSSRSDAEWLRDVLNRHSAAFGCRFVLSEEERLRLR